VSAPALHFVAIRDGCSYAAAVRVWGRPDIIHPIWDLRAAQEIVPGDIAVFGTADPEAPPSPYSWDDSARF
jgi:hypothetical protein